MGHSEIWRFGKYGLETLLLSILFFYSHLTLLLLALIPSLIRAYQLWNLHTPILFEVIIESTRIVLFLLMICLMTKRNIKDLRQKEFWEKTWEICSFHIRQNWPHRFIAQIIVFLVLLFGAGNLTINLIVSGTLDSIMEMLGFKSYNYSAAYNAYLYFFKNISVIPLAIVFILKICGVRPNNN